VLGVFGGCLPSSIFWNSLHFRTTFVPDDMFCKNVILKSLLKKVILAIKIFF
jgi:hypothetical protein